MCVLGLSGFGFCERRIILCMSTSIRRVLRLPNFALNPGGGLHEEDAEKHQAAFLIGLFCGRLCPLACNALVSN